MNKKILGSAVISALAFMSTGAKADLVNDGSMMLTITDGVGICLAGGTYPASCTYNAVTAAPGTSWFEMNHAFASLITQGTGIKLGSVQPFNGNAPSAGNAYDGSGTNITGPWPFFNNTGTNFTAAPANGTTTGLTSTLDLSGWRVAWGEVPSINMGGNGISIANGGFGTGMASISCTDAAGNASHCDIGDNYLLAYSAVVPTGDPSSFGGTPYDLHLAGTVSAVPVPAAVWLFGSGLLGLVGVARRRKVA